MIENFMAAISAWFGMDVYSFTVRVIYFLGVFNVLLILLAGLLFTLRRINRYVFANKQEKLKKILKPLSKLHPLVGITLVIAAFMHGELALGSVFRVHTGPLAWWFLFLMMLVALLGKKFRLKQWLPIHRSLALVMLVAVLLHLLARNILS